MHFVAMLLFAVGCLGSISSTVFLLLTLLGIRKFRRKTAHQARIDQAELPPVSILKPLRGYEPQLDENLASFFQQDYPRYEVLFAVEEHDDPAVAIVRAVRARYPHVPSRILVTSETPWPNPPAYAFACMADAARYDILVTSDSDVFVDPDYLREVVPPLLERDAGMLTCVYRGLSKGGFWSTLDAIGMSVEMTAGVLTANLMEGMKFGLGPTIVVRRDALDRIGGYRALRDYLANDFVIGNKIAAEGFEVVLSGHVISHVVPPMTFSGMWERQLRWAAGTRRSRPLGHFGTGLIFATPFGLLAAAMGPSAHHPEFGLFLLGWAIFNRMAESIAVGWGVTGDRDSLTRAWLYPVRDLLGFCVWAASFLSRSTLWRGRRFDLLQGGKLQQSEPRESAVSVGAST